MPFDECVCGEQTCVYFHSVISTRVRGFEWISLYIFLLWVCAVLTVCAAWTPKMDTDPELFQIWKLRRLESRRLIFAQLTLDVSVSLEQRSRLFHPKCPLHLSPDLQTAGFSPYSVPQTKLYLPDITKKQQKTDNIFIDKILKKKTQEEVEHAWRYKPRKSI